MASDSILIKNIGRLVTMNPGAGREGALGVIEKAAVCARDGKIVWLGRANELLKDMACDEELDAEGAVVLPGLVDCHTHIVHAGFRQGEFSLRSQGKTYQDIAKAGGGIISTVRATRAASLNELLDTARGRAMEALLNGTTTVEIKTGYGLDVETETKMVEVIRALGGAGTVSIAGTFLGAHIVPPEYTTKRTDYIRLVIECMLPSVAKSGVITACDVFVEEGAFTKDEARVIAGAAKKLGLGLHLHVDQFSDSGGGGLSSELGALSADHLDYTSEKGMRAMAEAGVTAVILPGASFFAGRGRYPSARKMIDLNLKVAIATDYNPGTNPSLDLFLTATIAVTQMGLTCDEALLGVTKNAATALGLKDRGVIANGARADIIILDAPDEYFPIYRYGKNCVREVIINGRVI